MIAIWKRFSKLVKQDPGHALSYYAQLLRVRTNHLSGNALTAFKKGKVRRSKRELPNPNPRHKKKVALIWVYE